MGVGIEYTCMARVRVRFRVRVKLRVRFRVRGTSYASYACSYCMPYGPSESGLGSAVRQEGMDRVRVRVRIRV